MKLQSTHAGTHASVELVAVGFKGPVRKNKRLFDFTTSKTVFIHRKEHMADISAAAA